MNKIILTNNKSNNQNGLIQFNQIMKLMNELMKYKTEWIDEQIADCHKTNPSHVYVPGSMV